MSALSLKKAILDLIFPIRCLGCGREGDLCCALCQSKLYFVPPTCFVCKKMIPDQGRIPPGRTCAACRKKSCIYAFLSPFLYDDDIIRELIHALKYRRIRDLALILGDMLWRYVHKFGIILPKGALLISIPLHPGRQRTRGFNQAELIARRVGERLNLPVAVDIFTKVKKTTPQVELSAEERRKNVVNTFVVPNASLVLGKTIFLFDDVKTTGATMEEAARVLKDAGAKRIWAVTVAR